MSDWTRLAAEKVCREIFATVAYPDEALIERVRVVIEAQSQEQESQVAAMRGVLIKLQAGVKTGPNWATFTVNEETLALFQSCLSYDAGRSLLERLRQAEEKAADAEQQFHIAQRQANALASQIGEWQATATTARREAFQQVLDMARSTSGFYYDTGTVERMIRALLEKEQK